MGEVVNKAELLKLARQYFIADAGLSTANLIRKIQIAEGNVDCFATGKKQCEQMTCRWRAECLTDSAEASTDAADAASVDQKER